MESENSFGEQHEVSEQFPSREEIKSAFETILQGQQYKELRVLSNEKGVYLYEIEVVLENGERVEYDYRKANYDYKKKSLPTKAQFSASIHMTSYNTEGEPDGGGAVANYLNGAWIYIP